jgi:hypothetical protein
MRGVDVSVRSPVSGQKDALGNPTVTWDKPRTVSNVLVSAGSASDSKDTNRPDGVIVTYTCVWPKSDSSSLRGCQVQVPGDSAWYSVIGDPKATPDGQMARRFRDRNRVVEVTRDDG